jgi:hypothetical protein
MKPIIADKGIIPFSKDFHPEFDGYIGEQGKGVFISAIESKDKGKGKFSRFLEELKAKYEWIKVPTPSNTMTEICLKKGFVLKEEWFPEPFNETGEVLYWERRKSA